MRKIMAHKVLFDLFSFLTRAFLYLYFVFFVYLFSFVDVDIREHSLLLHITIKASVRHYRTPFLISD